MVFDSLFIYKDSDICDDECRLSYW